jgi:hypothetical protein
MTADHHDQELGERYFKPWTSQAISLHSRNILKVELIINMALKKN